MLDKKSDGRISVDASGYWLLENEVSHGLNRMKAKIYNLIEASIPDTKQQEALKGLIRGFANDEYGIMVSNLRHISREIGFLEEGDDSEIPPMPAFPLEVRD